MAMLFNKRILITQITLMTILLLPSCNNEIIKLSNLPLFYEVETISTRALKISNVFGHFPKVVSRNDTALRESGAWDTTSTEDCYRDFLYLLVVTDKDTIHTFLKDGYFLNDIIHAKGYCDTVKDIDKVVHIIPNLKHYKIPNEKFQLISCESKSGDFWKVPNKCFRPECLGKWKHGYSKGTGIYNAGRSYKKVYWVYVW